MTFERLLILLLGLAMPAAAQGPEILEPGEPIDYARLAFRPEVWKQKEHDTHMLPWEGEEIVFLTVPGDYDRARMHLWVDRLDAGWRVYRDLTGTAPRGFKLLDGKPTIAAVPSYEFTCGAGCGYVGLTGIELAMFYDRDYPRLSEKPEVMPHYVFYEMGRNFQTFGDRHSCFTTGFAVFMRYVCMDALGVADENPRTRRTIEEVEERIAVGEQSFLWTFTNAAGAGEKAPRVRDAKDRWIRPSDQPVTYASAMLRLRRDCGGDAWVKRFFAALRKCPPAPRDTEEGALRQCLAWYVASSVAARRNLAEHFVDRWRLPLTEEQRQTLERVDWTDGDLEAVDVLARLVTPASVQNGDR